MYLRRKNEYQQHRALQDLEAAGNATFYVTSQIETSDDLTQAAMYIDKLDGRIDDQFFDTTSAKWRKEQDHCLREMGCHQSADQSYLEEGVLLLELANNAGRLFPKQEPLEQRRLLKLYYRTQSGKTVSSPRLSDNRLIFLRKQRRSRRRCSAREGQIRPRIPVGWGTRIRT